MKKLSIWSQNGNNLYIIGECVVFGIEKVSKKSGKYIITLAILGDELDETLGEYESENRCREILMNINETLYDPEKPNTYTMPEK